MLLLLYNLEHTLIGGLKNCKDAKVESVLSSGDKTLSFSWHQRNRQSIPQEYYIRTATDEYVVKENSKGSNGYRNIVANLNLEDLEGRSWMEYTIEGKTAQEAADYALADTGWTCISSVPDNRMRNISMKMTTSHKLIEKILDAFTCEVQFDTIHKIVYLKERVGQDKGAYFIQGLNLKELTENVDTYDYATRIIPIGADGLMISSVNEGREYLENYQYSNKVKTLIWEDTNYTDAQALKEDAEYKLNEISKPKRSLTAKLVDLAKLKPEYSILSYSVGDIITVINNEDGIKEKQRITKTVEYLDNPEKNTCDISNTVLSFEEMQKKLFAAAECIGNITTDNGTINGSKVDAIDVTQIIGLERYVAEDIDDLKVNSLYVRTEFGTPNAVIGELTGTTAKITKLEVTARENSVLSYISELHADMTYGNYAKFTTIESENISALEARVNTFVANNITTEYLFAHYAQIDFANVDTASIRLGFLENLMVSQGIIADRVIGSEIVATDVLTGVNLYADDIIAGTLSVDRLVFRGDEKSIVYQLNNISGALQAVSVDTLNGEIITPRSITADRIVAQSITATEIDVKDLVVTGLIGANRLTAANIYVDDLQALGATIGGFTIGATAIYNGTSSKISTTAGIYLGIDAIRAYYTGDVYTHIEKGVLKTNSALFVDRIYIASSVENTPYTAAIFNISNSESYTILSGIDEGGAEYEAAYVFSTFAKIHTMAYFSTDNLDVNHSSIFRGSVKFNECIDIDEAARIGKASIRNFLRIGGTLNVAGISTLAHTAIGGYDNTSYSLSANSFICNSWVRTVGNCGWYNETYGGGWYMIDSTYIRNYNSKHLLLSGNCYFGGTTYYVNSSGNTHFSNIYTGDRVNGAGNTGCAITNYGCMHLSRASSNGNPYVALFYNNAASATAQWTSISASCSSLSGYVNFGTNTAQSSYRAYVNGDVYCTGFVCAGAPRPSVNSTSNSTGYYLGTSSYKWRTVYAYNTSISTSDRNEKHDIFYDLDKTELEKVFDGLRLCTYVMNGGKRTHIGCIAQDIEENLVKNGYSMDDWAFLCRDHVYEEVEAESGLQKVYKYNEDGSPKYIYGLRYAELSMLTVWQTQKLKTRVSEIQRNLERVDLQEQRIQELQQQIHTLQYELDKAKLKIEKMETVA